MEYLYNTCTNLLYLTKYDNIIYLLIINKRIRLILTNLIVISLLIYAYLILYFEPIHLKYIINLILLCNSLLIVFVFKWHWHIILYAFHIFCTLWYILIVTISFYIFRYHHERCNYSVVKSRDRILQSKCQAQWKNYRIGGTNTSCQISFNVNIYKIKF